VIGTRAHGRSHVYRHYTCYARARYETSRCSASRTDADAGAAVRVITGIMTWLLITLRSDLDPPFDR
jgi:hypothetical protein